MIIIIENSFLFLHNDDDDDQTPLINVFKMPVVCYFGDDNVFREKKRARFLFDLLNIIIFYSFFFVSVQFISRRIKKRKDKTR